MRPRRGRESRTRSWPECRGRSDPGKGHQRAWAVAYVRRFRRLDQSGRSVLLLWRYRSAVGSPWELARWEPLLPRLLRGVARGFLLGAVAGLLCGLWGIPRRWPQRRDARRIARTLSAMRVLGTWSEGPSPRFRGGRSLEGSVAFLDRSRVGCRRACPARRRRASRVLAVRAGPLPGAGEFAGGQAGEQGRRPARDPGRLAAVRGSGDRARPAPGDGPRSHQAKGARGRGLRRPGLDGSVLPHPDRFPGGVWLPGGAGAPALSPATHGSPNRPAMEGCA